MAQYKCFHYCGQYQRLFLPIASYWLDTPLQTVAPGTYTDSTGTIVT